MLIQLFKYERAQEQKSLNNTDAMIHSRILQDKYDNSLDVQEMLKEQNVDYDAQIQKLRTMVDQLMSENQMLRENSVFRKTSIIDLQAARSSTTQAPLDESQQQIDSGIALFTHHSQKHGHEENIVIEEVPSESNESQTQQYNGKPKAAG